jgi:hypothetical protein
MHQDSEQKLEWVLRCAQTDLRLAIREGLRDLDATMLRERLLMQTGGEATRARPSEEEAAMVLGAIASERAAHPDEDADVLAERCLTASWLRAAGVCLQTLTLRPGMAVTAAHRAMTADLPVEDVGGGGPFLVWDCFVTVTRAQHLGYASTDGQLRVRHVTSSEIGLLRSVPTAVVPEEMAALDARDALRMRIDAAMALLSGSEADLAGEAEPEGAAGERPRRSTPRVNLFGTAVADKRDAGDDLDEEAPETSAFARRPTAMWGGAIAAAVLVGVLLWFVWPPAHPDAGEAGRGEVAATGGAPLAGPSADVSAASEGDALAGAADDAASAQAGAAVDDVRLSEAEEARKAAEAEELAKAEDARKAAEAAELAKAEEARKAAEAAELAKAEEARKAKEAAELAKAAKADAARRAKEAADLAKAEEVRRAQEAAELARAAKAEYARNAAALAQAEGARSDAPGPPYEAAGGTRSFHPNLQLTRLAKLYSGDGGQGVKLRELDWGKELMGRCVVQTATVSETTVRLYKGYRAGRLLCTGDLQRLCDQIGCPPGQTVCDVGMAWLQPCDR